MKKTIAISHQKGGVGKSLLSLHLCGAIPGAIIIDLDTQSSCAYISNARETPFNVISINTNDQDAEKQLFKILDQYEGKETIIIDCGGFDSSMNRTAIANSDIVLTPVKDNSFEILAFKRFMEILNEVQVKSDVKGFALINNVNAQTKDFDRLRDLISKSNITLLDTIIRQRADFNNTLEAGTTVTEVTMFSKASKEILDLIQELKGKI